MRHGGRSRRVRLGAAVLAATAAWMGPAVREADAAEVPTKHHRDAVHKFSFKVFDDWDPVPVEVGEEYEVCKFVQAGDRGRDAPRVHVFRLASGKAGKPEVTGGADEEPPKPPPGMPPEVWERIRASDKPKDMVTLLNEQMSNFMFKEKIAPKTGKAVESRDKVPGYTWTLVGDHPFAGKYLMVFATWKKDEVEFGMWLRCEATQRKKYEAGFKSVVDSFTWHDGKAKDVKSLEVLDGLNITPKKRRQIERGLVKGWNVIVSPKKNYIVIYNTKGKRNDQLAKTIARNIEAIREQVYEVQFPPAKKIEAVSICRVCGDAAEYHAYGGPGGSAGYWSSGTEELVFYDASPSRQIDDDTVAVLYHEAFHQYIFYSAGSAAPHSWFNEGHGDYYAGAKYSAGKFKIGPFNWRVGTVKNAIRAGPCTYQTTTGKHGTSRTWDRSNKGYSPLAALVEMDQGEYYAYPAVSYAQGWSLIYFLREIVPKNPKWNAKWGKILPTYFDTLKAEIAKGRDATTGPRTGPGAPERPEPDAPEPPEPDEPEPPEPGGMGEPKEPPEPGGKGEPPAPGDEPPPPSDNPEDFMGIPQFLGGSDEKALKKALEEAFKGIDFAELEKAWVDSILKVPG